MDCNLRLSTMTGVSKLSDSLNLDKLFNVLEIDKNIKFLEYGVKYKGEIDLKNLKKRDKGTKKFFYNQITTHLYTDFSDINKKVNVKIFNNGSIQMTGLKNKNQGNDIIKYLFDKIKNLNENNNICNIDNFKIYHYSIVMINTDFDIGFNINRSKLNRHIINNNIFSSYEPCVYPGVKIKYYYKKNKNNGMCNCSSGICKGKGLDDSCKKITIAVFNSGKIIITGGNTIEQCEEAYNFIKKILLDNKEFLIDKSVNE